VDQVPKDIVICDWHYGKASKTAAFFAGKGFPVVESPWRNSAVALAELAEIRSLRAGSDPKAAAAAMGMLQTTWVGFAPFLEAYKSQSAGAAAAKGEAGESAACFRALCKAMREAK
jgi:hypothetical protein